MSCDYSTSSSPFEQLTVKLNSKLPCSLNKAYSRINTWGNSISAEFFRVSFPTWQSRIKCMNYVPGGNGKLYNSNTRTRSPFDTCFTLDSGAQNVGPFPCELQRAENYREDMSAISKPQNRELLFNKMPGLQTLVSLAVKLYHTVTSWYSRATFSFSLYFLLFPSTII